MRACFDKHLAKHAAYLACSLFHERILQRLSLLNFQQLQYVKTYMLAAFSIRWEGHTHARAVQHHYKFVQRDMLFAQFHYNHPLTYKNVFKKVIDLIRVHSQR